MVEPEVIQQQRRLLRTVSQASRQRADQDEKSATRTEKMRKELQERITVVTSTRRDRGMPSVVETAQRELARVGLEQSLHNTQRKEDVVHIELPNNTDPTSGLRDVIQKAWASSAELTSHIDHLERWRQLRTQLIILAVVIIGVAVFLVTTHSR